MKKYQLALLGSLIPSTTFACGSGEMSTVVFEIFRKLLQPPFTFVELVLPFVFVILFFFLVICIFFLIKYFKEKKNKQLWVGLIAGVLFLITSFFAIYAIWAVTGIAQCENRPVPRAPSLDSGVPTAINNLE